MQPDIDIPMTTFEVVFFTALIVACLITFIAAIVDTYRHREYFGPFTPPSGICRYSSFRRNRKVKR